jgi:hypothetical protein
MDQTKWPYNPNSKSVDRQIDWQSANPLAFDSSIAIWKRVDAVDLKKLTDDARYRRVYSGLSAEQKETIQAAQDGRVPRSENVSKTGNEKDALLSLLQSVLDEASDAGDLSAKLKTIELRAKLNALLNQKQEEDRNIVINVITGVER